MMIDDRRDQKVAVRRHQARHHPSPVSAQQPRPRRRSAARASASPSVHQRLEHRPVYPQYLRRWASSARTSCSPDDTSGRDVAGRRQVRIDRSLLSVEGGAGHITTCCSTTTATRKADGDLLPLHHPHAPPGPHVMDHRLVPDRRGRAGGHEGGVHQRGRLLRHPRHQVRRSGAVVLSSQRCCGACCSTRPAARTSPKTRATTPSSRACARWMSSTGDSGARQGDPRGRGRKPRRGHADRSPYHSDPGLNHGVLEEFQALGYPILSMRSIPKDRAGSIASTKKTWTRAHRRAARSQRRLAENYSANSVQKVWAAKFARVTPTSWCSICRRSSAVTMRRPMA